MNRLGAGARCAAVASVVLLAGIVLAGLPDSVPADEQPFGSKADRSFAQALWTAMNGYTDWPMQTDVYRGTRPHGAFLRMYYSIVEVDDESYHVIVKDNYAAEEGTPETVADNPEEHLAAVTVMLQREPGYDPEHGDWFYVKYLPDGKIAENDQEIALAGRVAKGTGSGCLACHANAQGDDYVFFND